MRSRLRCRRTTIGPLGGFGLVGDLGGWLLLWLHRNCIEFQHPFGHFYSIKLFAVVFKFCWDISSSSNRI